MIAITLLEYNFSNGKASPRLVEFSAATEAAAKQFVQAKKETKRNQTFGNTNDFFETKYLGINKKYIRIIDDPVYSIAQYQALADKAGAKFVILTDDIESQIGEHVEDSEVIAIVKRN